MDKIQIYRTLCEVRFPNKKLTPPYNMMEIVDTIDRKTFITLLNDTKKLGGSETENLTQPIVIYS